MARMSYLQRRGSTYYARMKVPSELVAYFGRREFTQTLGTKQLDDAKRRVWAVVEQWHREIDEAKNRRDLTMDDRQNAAWDHYEATLERDNQERTAAPSEDDIAAEVEKVRERIERDGIDLRDNLAMIDATAEVALMKDKRTGDASLEARSRKVKLEHLQRHLAIGEFSLISHEVDEYIRNNNLRVPPGSQIKDQLARSIMRAHIEALRRLIERDRGDYSGTPHDQIIAPPRGSARTVAEPGHAIMDLFERYARENPNGIKPDTLNQARRDIGHFAHFVGVTFPIAQLGKEAVRDWKLLLLEFPVKATESKVFAGMKMAQIVNHNKQVGKPTISKRTVNRYLSNLSAFCQWLVAHGYIQSNPTEGMELSKEGGTRTLPFNSDQLTTIFTSPLFVGCRHDESPGGWLEPGKIMIRDHRYWVPLIMAFSGARPGEIAQLSVGDVREEHGCWIMHVTDDGDGEKSVKTQSSKRIIPVHSELQRLGFIEYCKQAKASGADRLFPLAERNSRGQMIADFSREFPRYLTRLDIKTGRGLSLYSFRHGATDALRRAGLLDDQFGFILGHGKATTTGRYGIMPQGILEDRVKLIESITYPGLSLAHLYPSQGGASG